MSPTPDFLLCEKHIKSTCICIIQPLFQKCGEIYFTKGMHAHIGKQDLLSIKVITIRRYADLTMCVQDTETARTIIIWRYTSVRSSHFAESSEPSTIVFLSRLSSVTETGSNPQKWILLHVNTFRKMHVSPNFLNRSCI